MSEFTPGPWFAVEFSNGDVLVEADPAKNRPPPICDGRLFICRMDEDEKRGVDKIANARLIAAAPDLLKALRWYVEHDDVDEGMAGNFWLVDGLNRAKSVIAKAVGSAS